MLISCLATACVVSSAPEGYKLVWSDEFKADGLPDPSKWVYDTGANKHGWYNNEKQYYSAARLQNSRVSHGKLIITARKEDMTSAADYGGQHYTSARLITRGKSSWTYGFVEVRAKLPKGVGSWPAIWMLGTRGGWPACGETDIMEQVGNKPTTILGTLHMQAAFADHGIGGKIEIRDADSAFHNYQVLWTHESISFSVDGKVYKTYHNPGKGVASWPFDQPQFLILNLAIGGNLTSGVIDDHAFPMHFEIEYARVYQKG